MTRTLAPSPVAAPVPPVEPLRWLALSLLLLPQLTRASTTLTTFPAWDIDPLIYPIGSPALTPAGSLLCDAISLLGAALLLLPLGKVSRTAQSASSPPHPLAPSPHLPLILLSLIGAAALAYHAWIGGPYHGSLANQRIGASWLSAIFGALALWHAAQDLRIRRAVVGVLLGYIALLAVYGAVQVFYIHPQSVADFRADEAKALAAHGWSPDSPMAKAFVRRLIQPEATGWFGLANVYATFAAGGVVGGLGLIYHLYHVRSRTASGLAALICAGAFTCLAAGALELAQSKGGTLAAATGFAAMLVLPFIARRSADHSPSRVWRSLAGAIGIAAIIGPILLVICRGLIGERIGELSLLFRWFYDEASLRIFLDHPVIGVGPEGFQRAFTLAKPPQCPEEVLSPHCIVVDWLADLGVLGLAWVCVLGRFAWQATTNAIAPSPADPSDAPLPPPPRSAVRFLLLVPAGVTILAALLESPLITPEIALVRIVGLVLWGASAWAIASAITGLRGSRIALAGAALALIAHAQIDVAASSVPSTALWAMLIALAAAPNRATTLALRQGGAENPKRPLTDLAPTVAALCILALSLATARSAWTAHRWTQALELAAATVRPTAQFNERLSSLSPPPIPGAPRTDSIDLVVRDLTQELGHPIAHSQASVTAALAELERRLLPLAATQLENAWTIYPDDRRPLREASRLHAELARIAVQQGDQKSAAAAFDLAAQITRLLPAPGAAPIANPSASEWHWLAGILEERAARLSDRESLRRAAAVRETVARLDPYNLDNAVRLFRNYQALGDAAQTKAWARHGLDLDKDMRLDREIRGLSDKDRAALNQAAGAPPPP